MLNLITEAIRKGAQIFPNVSGGKDGQAMTKVISSYGLPMEALVHADLGRVEWKESLPMCEKLSKQFNLPLHVVTRTDGLDMLGRWQKRMHQLEGQGKPFWSSSQARYCTSDLKRDPINHLYRNLDTNFIISAEGVRGQESKEREKKIPLTIRWKITSSFYKGMTVERAIDNFRPDKRLALTWYPIFEFSLEDVWGTYNMSSIRLELARAAYNESGIVPAWWPFHPAYVYGNERVSCAFCVFGSLNDLSNGAIHHPDLLDEMIAMEEYSGFTFKNDWSLASLKPQNQKRA